jgi:hypothetical protein
MTTVGAVIDRLFLQTLTPPNAQPVLVSLVGAISASDTTLTMGTFAVPEDAALLRQGVVLDVGLESMRVTSYVLGASTMDVERGIYSTTKVAHEDGDPIIMSPVFARSTVFQAVADNITTLYPSLASTDTEQFVSVGAGIFPVEDGLAVEVIEIWDSGMAEDLIPVDGRFVSYHPLVGTRALLANTSSGIVWCRYRKRMGVATDETDVIADLGVDDRWVNIILAGAAADLMSGKDVPETHTEWVSATLEAENIKVGTRMSIAGGLRQYRNILLSDASNEMIAEDSQKIKVHMNVPAMGGGLY